MDLEPEAPDCVIFYCLVDENERLEPTELAVKERATSAMIGVAAGARLGDVIEQIEKKLGIVKMSYLHATGAWMEISERNRAVQLHKGWRMFFRCVRAGKPLLECLLEKYEVQTRVSRSIQTACTWEESLDDPGSCFELVEREATYDVLLKGAGQMFSQFCGPSQDVSTYRAGAFFFAMVAFPGAGKTTLGKRGWPFLKNSWEGLAENRKQGLLGQSLSGFTEMVAASLKHNLVMYHEVANDGGGLLQQERGLAMEVILGLRALYMIIYDRFSTTSYSSFLRELDTEFPGIKQVITFRTALDFLQKALALDAGKRYMATFFFDEVNSIDCNLDGTKAASNEATWFQQLMSEYVSAHHVLARDNYPIFPVCSIATTRFSAADLRFTLSRKSLAVLVPFPPLSVEGAKKVVLGYVQKVANAAARDPPQQLTKSLRYMILLAGGMPRYLSLGLKALSSLEKSPDNIYCACTKELWGNKVEFDKVMFAWRELLGHRSLFAKYQELGRYPMAVKVLLEVLAMGVLGRQVERRQSVVPGGESYWELESSGVTALTSMKYVATDDPGVGQSAVKLCPLLIQPLVEQLGGSYEWPGPWPPLSDQSSRMKEIADALSILLRIFLCGKVQGPFFELREVLPPGCFVPSQLNGLQFRLQDCAHAFKLKEHNKQGSGLAELRALSFSGVLGPGNRGLDWFLFLQVQERMGAELVDVEFGGESKISVNVDNLTLGYILNEFQIKMGEHYTLPDVPDDAMKKVTELSTQRAQRKDLLEDRLNIEVKGRSVSNRTRNQRYGELASEFFEEIMDTETKKRRSSLDFLKKMSGIFVICSTKPVPEETMYALSELEEMHPWVKHIVVLNEQAAAERNDPLSVLSQLRSMAPRGS